MTSAFSIISFLTLEDETGLANIIVRPDLYEAHAAVWSRTEAMSHDFH